MGFAWNDMGTDFPDFPDPGPLIWINKFASNEAVQK